MNLEEWRLTFVAAAIALALMAITPTIAMVLPRNEEPFMAMATLGKDGKAENYYPGDDPSIGLGETVNWSLYLYNHMGRAEYVVVKVKVLGEETPPPNSTGSSPSPAPAVYEIRRILANNETLITPFSWSISEANRSGDNLRISKMLIDGNSVNLNLTVPQRSNIRMVFELWSYDEDSQSFRFGWKINGNSKSVWNQILFNLKGIMS